MLHDHVLNKYKFDQLFPFTSQLPRLRHLMLKHFSEYMHLSMKLLMIICSLYLPYKWFGMIWYATWPCTAKLILTLTKPISTPNLVQPIQYKTFSEYLFCSLWPQFDMFHELVSIKRNFHSQFYSLQPNPNLPRAIRTIATRSAIHDIPFEYVPKKRVILILIRIHQQPYQRRTPSPAMVTIRQQF